MSKKTQLNNTVQELVALEELVWDEESAQQWPMAATEWDAESEEAWGEALAEH